MASKQAKVAETTKRTKNNERKFPTSPPSSVDWATPRRDASTVGVPPECLPGSPNGPHIGNKKRGNKISKKNHKKKQEKNIEKKKNIFCICCLDFFNGVTCLHLTSSHGAHRDIDGIDQPPIARRSPKAFAQKDQRAWTSLEIREKNRKQS